MQAAQPPRSLSGAFLPEEAWKSTLETEQRGHLMKCTGSQVENVKAVANVKLQYQANTEEKSSVIGTTLEQQDSCDGSPSPPHLAAANMCQLAHPINTFHQHHSNYKK